MPLEPFKDELPRLGKMNPVANSDDDEDCYEIGITSFAHSFHSDMDGNPIPVWGYDGTYPGKIIEATRNRPVQVKWKNKLTQWPHGNPPLPATEFPFEIIAPPVTDPGHSHPSTPGHAVVHLHGAHVPAHSDGWPESFLHPKLAGHGKSSVTFQYPNQQQGALLWYHDHTAHLTHLNVYAGLAGPYILREHDEASLGLPSGKYEIPLMIQDRSFDSREKPTRLKHDVTTEQPEFFGDFIVVNGKIWPKLTVEPRRYRFRVVNGSNSRFYRLSIDSPSPTTALFPLVFQIATDGGFLAHPIQIGTAEQLKLTLAPGERADLIVDFTACAVGDEFVLKNDARSPFPGDPTNQDGTPELNKTDSVLKFIVGALTGIDESRPVNNLVLPSDFTTSIGGKKVSMTDIPAIAAALVAAALPKIRIRTRTLTEDANKMVLLDSRGWEEPVTETPLLNSVEIWNLDNWTGDAHPIHLHLVQFMVLDRTPLIPDEPITPIEPNERGWKDTLRCPPQQRTQIIVHFTDYAGWYVWHCHMLEHEDHDMMRPLYVRHATEPDGVQANRPGGMHHH
jgi:spore coat protein A, manganese oxidase